MIKFSKQRGFSLIELMIVVAIMAILAAIAIPSFMRFQMKAKTSEATTNLGAIRTCEEAYRAENDVYWTCTASPPLGGTDAKPDAWEDAGALTGEASDTSFQNIGFAPDGPPRYMYEVVVPSPTADGPPGPSFIATAISDLDEDKKLSTYTVDTQVPTYPKAIRTGDDY